MTKREYFAAMAMQSFINVSKELKLEDVDQIAWKSVIQADALIKELNKNEKNETIKTDV